MAEPFTDNSRQPQQGFTFLELIAVVVIISLVAASGTVYYGNVLQDIRRTGVEMLANRFTAAISLVHAQWILQGGYRQGTHGGMPVDVSGLVVYTNASGWPVNTDGSDTGGTNRNAEACYQVWQAVLQNPAPATVEGRAAPAGASASAKGRQRYHISLIDGGICRYELVTAPEGTHYFDYTLTTGQVLLTVPPLD